MAFVTSNITSDRDTFGNFTNETIPSGTFIAADSINLLAAISVLYIIIFILGLLGNTSTCIVIAKNRSMHTATNFYLFSLAISDLVLLLCGLPLEIYRLWYPATYPLGNVGCIGLGLASETSTNATILTITAFTVERYIAICRPFMSHTMSKLSRAVRFIMGIWTFALCTAIPQAMQFGLVTFSLSDQIACTVTGQDVDQVFVISSFVFFVVPMSLIIVLYVQIGLRLRNSSVLHPVKNVSSQRTYRSSTSQRRVIRMLVAVTLSFFLCWAPFHVQRLLAIYGKNMKEPSDIFVMVYIALNYISGIFYYLSTAINPILYNIMSNKFREAFKTTLSSCFGKHKHNSHRKGKTYNSLLTANSRNKSLTDVLGQDSIKRPMATAITQASESSSTPVQLHNGHISPVTEGRNSVWNLALKLKRSRKPSEETIRSISNSSLKEVDEELTGEELTTFMHQVNTDIGFT